MDYSVAALGEVIRRARTESGMTQSELGALAGYAGTGASISISRIERGAMRPSGDRLAQIALALEQTPEQLVSGAQQLASEAASAGADDEVPSSLRERKAQTQRRHEIVTERVGDRARETEERLTAFNAAHDAARDNYFLRFVALAQAIENAPVPEPPEQDGVNETSDDDAATIQLRAISSGIGHAIAGATAGTIAGAAAGGAAAYAAFTAVAAFGTASTGTAISALTGVAATNATLAVLGGGTLAAGGAGMAGGAMLLTGMVAAPAALLAGAGFYYAKRRRTEREEEQLRTAVTAAEAALDSSQEGYASLIGFLDEAAKTCEYINFHGTHALEQWATRLPAGPRVWGELDVQAQAMYAKFLEAAASLVMLSRIQIAELLTADKKSLESKNRAIDETLNYVDRTVRACF